jgi:hypothetical protein
LPQRLLGLGLVEVGRRCAGALPLRVHNGAIRGGGGGGVMLRPRRRVTASRSHPPASLTPPPRALGLARASSPIGPIQAEGRRRRGSPPRPPDHPPRGQALVGLSARRLPPL